MEIKFEIHYPKRSILYSVIKSLALHQKPETYLEIGVNEGQSLSQLLEDCSPKSITLCDIWNTSYGGTGREDHTHIEALLEKLKYKGDVKYLDGDSKILLPTIVGKLEFDLILVDGHHAYNNAWMDLWNAWHLLKKGGIIIFDDVIHPHHKYLIDCIDNFVGKSGAKVLYSNFKQQNGVVVIQKNE